MNPKFEIPKEYIKNHFEKSDHLCVALIKRNENGSAEVQQEFRTAEQIVDERYMAHLRAANAHGADVYLTVNCLHEGSTGRTKSDVDQIRHIYLDIDSGGKEAVDKILNAPGVPKPHAVLETSPGKHQVLWSVEGFDKEQAENLVRGMAHAHDADQAVWDTARVLRIPGFRNCKYENPHYVKDVLPEEQRAGYDKLYRPEDFPRYEVQREAAAPKFGERPAGGERSFSTGGSQSEKDYAYAMRQLERGTSPDVIERKIADYRRGRNDKKDPDGYAKRTVRSAQARFVSRPLPPSVTAPRESERIR